MPLRLYNTLTRSLQDFTPLTPPQVTMYVCGPTVYDHPHLGHARSAFVFDLLRRYLQYKDFQVRFIRNVTDVDDKIIDKARQDGTTGDLNAACRTVAERYLQSYHDAMDRLGIAHPDLEPKATEHVTGTEERLASMVNLISELLVKGAAYETGGDVYFSVRKFPNYGRLSNRTLDELQTGTRIEPDEHKRDPLDFALWKSAKPGEPAWNSPWGKGRPGWHIECTVMSTLYLGDSFDIHGGGVDLVFPHHENEIAQAHAAGKPFAQYWVHNGLLTVKGEKMSKSLGNYITVDQALQESVRGVDALKMFFLGTHYRNPINYTTENLFAASARLATLETFLNRADTWRSSGSNFEEPPKEVAGLKKEFEAAMDEDMNTPQALAALDKLVNLGYQWEQKLRLKLKQPGDTSPPSYQTSHELPTIEQHVVQTADTLLELSRVLGILLDYRSPSEYIPKPVYILVEQREAARLQKDFKKSDMLRKQVEEMGYVVEDTPRGPVVLPKRR